jgi:Cu-Zn family superoxide dismutase
MKRNILFLIAVSFALTAPVYASVGVATIKGTMADSPVEGHVTIKEKDDGILVQATLKHVPNAGKHGFHFHEVGNCGDGGKAAGGHFNPDNTPHGFLPKDGKQHAHLGDMGNIVIGPDGKGKFEEYLPGVYLTKTPSVGGHSIVLHEKEDDFSQPTGNAGGRIGCGVVELKDQVPEEAADDDDDQDDAGQSAQPAEPTHLPSNTTTQPQP